MRLLDSFDHTAWIACERCGNTYSGGGQGCSRCGNTPTIMQRLGKLSSPPNSEKVSARGVLPRTRSRRAARIALACMLCAGALVAYTLTKPYLAGIGHTPQIGKMHSPATGSLVQSGQVVTQGASVLPAKPSALNDQQNAGDETTRAQHPDVSAFYSALQAGNLSAARRGLARISVSSEGSSQLEKMRTELTSREHTRDALLHHAWHCRALGDWQCVADNATQAYAIDASSWEARHLVAMAAKETSKADKE
ncbi:hypothetical protein [Caballeronia sp. 15711]|uniref:hypothetical protein n=1 Tax=Caballeronia sp. 15711 TaxID=3391029 RepID=UPI0039E2A045